MRKNTDIFDRFLKKSIKEIVIEGGENLHKVEQKGVMLVSSHRSHLDYIMTGMRFNKDVGFVNMRFAAGDNLTRLPIMGKIFKQIGAFSVYRGKASQRKYLFKLIDQVKKMLVKSGDNIVVYPEGGRSYDGRFLDIKGGLLGASVIAEFEDKTKDYYIVPVTSSYEVLEEARFFPMLLKGKKWRDKGKNPIIKNIGALTYYFADILAFVFMRVKPKGCRAFIDIGSPMAIKDITDVEGNHNPKSKVPFLANGRSIKDVASFVSTALRKQFRILPNHIVAYLIEKGLNISNCKSEMDAILDEILKKGHNSKGIDGLHHNTIWSEGVTLLKKNKALKGKTDNPKVKNKKILSYFAGLIKDLRDE